MNSKHQVKECGLKIKCRERQARCIRWRLAFVALLCAVFSVSAASQVLDYQAAADYSDEHGGIAMVVLISGEVTYEHYAPSNPSTEGFHIHSGTKGFWGVVAAAMVEDSLLSFDELAVDTLTEWQGDEYKSLITVRHLLELTSGLVEDPDALQGLDGTAFNKYQYAVDLPALIPPGTKFRYGPSHYYAFGELIRRKLDPIGYDPLTYLQARIFHPIGLQVTDWVHDDAGNPHIPNGAYLTALNWARFGQLILQRGEWEGYQVIRSDLIEEIMHSRYVNPGHGLALWLNVRNGWGLGRGDRAPPGSPGGFIYPLGYSDMVAALGAGRSRMYIIPSKGMVVVRKAENPEDAFEDDVFLGLLFDEQHTPTIPVGPRISVY